MNLNYFQYRIWFKPDINKNFVIESSIASAHVRDSGPVVTLSTSKQWKSASGKTSRAISTPKSATQTSLRTDRIRITGAQEPSGIPFVAPIVRNKGPNRGTRKPRPNSAQRRRRPR